jgi:hypothetical protein
LFFNEKKKAAKPAPKAKTTSKDKAAKAKGVTKTDKKDGLIRKLQKN